MSNTEAVSGGESVTITMPLPPKELSPNYTVGSRGGRLGKAAKIKKYRHWSMVLAACKTGVKELGWPWKAATVRCVFFFKTRQRRDKDNLLASMKAGFDGFADAGLIADDAGLTHLPVEIAYDDINPRVVVTVTRQEGGAK